MRRALGVLIAAAALALIERVYGLALPWLLDELRRSASAFEAVAVARFVVDLVETALLALGAWLIARAAPSRAARVAAMVGAAALIGMLAAAFVLPLVLPSRMAVGSLADHVFTAGRMVPAVLGLGALIALALALRGVARPAHPRLAAAATAIAALAAIRVPVLVWSWLVGPLGRTWGVQVNVLAGTLLFAVVVIALRRDTA